MLPRYSFATLRATFAALAVLADSYGAPVTPAGRMPIRPPHAMIAGRIFLTLPPLTRTASARAMVYPGAIRPSRRSGTCTCGTGDTPWRLSAWRSPQPARSRPVRSQARSNPTRILRFSTRAAAATPRGSHRLPPTRMRASTPTCRGTATTPTPRTSVALSTSPRASTAGSASVSTVSTAATTGRRAWRWRRASGGPPRTGFARARGPGECRFKTCPRSEGRGGQARRTR